MFVSFSCIAENSSLVINWLLFLLLPDCLTLLLKKKNKTKTRDKIEVVFDQILPLGMFVLPPLQFIHYDCLQFVACS